VERKGDRRYKERNPGEKGGVLRFLFKVCQTAEGRGWARAWWWARIRMPLQINHQ